MYLTFRSGDDLFAVAMAAVEEVVPAEGLRPLAGARPDLEGVLVHRGSVVGVFAPGAARASGTEVLILAGSPGVGLLGTASDAVTREFDVDAAGGVLHCLGGSFHLLDAAALRARLGADATGDEDDEQDPAGG